MASFKKSVFEELRNIVEDLRKYSPVLLNLPAGLSVYAAQIKDHLGDEGIEAYIYADESFGGCDIPTGVAKALGCKSIVHFSHTQFIKGKTLDGIRIFYVPVFAEYDVKRIAEIIAHNIKVKSLSLCAHLQYVRGLKDIKKILEEKGFRVYLEKSPLQDYAGQITGCEVLASYISYEKGCSVCVYIGDGKFHYYALLKDAPSQMDVAVVDPYTLEFRYFSAKEREKIIQQYVVRYSLLKNSKKIGILLSSKIGQYLRFGKVFTHIIEEFRNQGKEVYVFVADKIDPKQLNAFKGEVEGFINFACPRIEDDSHLYDVPILSYSTYKKLERELNES